MQSSSNSSHNPELQLQESCTDPFASLVVYSNIDVHTVHLAMNGEDPSYIPLLPSGFVVTPATSSNHKNSVSNCQNMMKSPEGEPASSCLLTVGLQVLTSPIPSARINLSNVTAINTHICNVVHQISTILGGGSGLSTETNLK